MCPGVSFDEHDATSTGLILGIKNKSRPIKIAETSIFYENGVVAWLKGKGERTMGARAS